ncbi:MAG: single-stranded-DNA-specific exonuclease RecJ [Eggerthellaceae bacterium]|nr:single-stranded-DNA-specific exonuclease RecJ [Eggerthellaceae bacterium]
MSTQFNVRVADNVAVQTLMRDLGLPHFMAATLAARGIETPEDVQRFLSPSLERDWLDPYTIPGLKDVADALEAAIKTGKRIAVFGDFDLDGISATTVLTRGLRLFGAAVIPFIPRRFEEGYGITKEAFERLMSAECAPELIVTVDCGISSKVAAEAIAQEGIELLVTDHHEPGSLVPEDIPVADPKLDASCESAILAGVGVALKLVQALGMRFGKPQAWRDLTDFAALGTIADLMPMLGENRALVADGVARINARPRPCLAALLGVAGASGKPVSANNLSFSLIPRLNAAGRMGDAQLALDLLLADDFDSANELAAQLEGMNDKRRRIELELSEIAQAQADQIYVGQRALVVAGEGWHEGVKGIVASRLVGKYGVPALLFSIEGDQARGSGRSVGQVNLFKAVESVSDLLTRFGGHEAAVGVTLPVSKLPEFTERICAYMDSLPAEAFHPLVQIDTCVDLSELTLENVRQLDRLAPFGQQNPIPCFLARDVTLANVRAVGADKNHLSCMLSDGRASVAGIMFHCPDIAELLANDSVVNVAFQAQIDEWRGRQSVKAMIKSFVPARACQALEACLREQDKTFVADLYAACEDDACADETTVQVDSQAHRDELVQNRRTWEERASGSPEQLEQAIVRALLGNCSLHDSQRAVLSNLRHGRSVLSVMATGCGKSLIYQVHASLEALKNGKASLIIYPLRALAADQAFRFNAMLTQFGIASAALTGETNADERQRIFKDLDEGKIDIISTTPEFFLCHAARFASSQRIDFVVIDGAHRIGGPRAEHRRAYSRLRQGIDSLGHPTVLALIATVNDDIADDLLALLPIDDLVVDESPRENLHIDDQRNLKNRDDYLANLVARGEKTLIYVNSREQSIAVARILRKRVPQLSMLIGFYNAGLTLKERRRIEELFRSNALLTLVATSAFDEGVNIPNIRHVVLYHLPFNEIQFAQMSSRAGRDGQAATVHLLFGVNDALVNERILRDMTPDHDVLAEVYRWLRSMQREHRGHAFTVGVDDMMRMSEKSAHRISVASTICGIAVFSELGLIEAHTCFIAGRKACSISVKEDADRVELTDSIRYQEGLGEQEVFQAFREWVFECDDDSLRQRVSYTIAPFDRSQSEGGDLGAK